MARLLEVAGLAKSFGGVAALADVHFRAPPDVVYAVIGPNGAGKSTLFNTLCGFYRPDEGSIQFVSEPLVGLAPHAVAARW